MTAKEKILNALTKSGKLTVAQAKSRFGIKNVWARVAELRDDGHDIQTSFTTKKDGTKSYFYSLSKPTTTKSTTAKKV